MTSFGHFSMSIHEQQSGTYIRCSTTDTHALANLAQNFTKQQTERRLAP